jgi:hypothetical protein
MAPGPAFGEFFLAYGNRLFELIDNGQQVLEQPALPVSAAVAELAVVGGSLATLVARDTNNGLYILRGRTWSALNAITGGSIAAGDGLILIANGGQKLNTPGSISFTDAGTTWAKAKGLPYDQTVEAIAGQTNSTTFFTYCYGGDVYASADSGQTWEVVSRALRSRTG